MVLPIERIEEPSLKSQDDRNFILAVLDIAWGEEDDFELCGMVGIMYRELAESGGSVASLFMNRPSFITHVINAFLYADVDGGCYNKRLYSISEIYSVEVVEDVASLKHTEENEVK